MACPAADTLGVHIEGCNMSGQAAVWPSSKRLSRVRAALLWLWEKPRMVTGKMVERLLGHLTNRFLLMRPMLSVLCHAYQFARANYMRKTVLWPSVREELKICYGLLPLTRSAIGERTAPEVFMTDACMTVFAGGERQVGLGGYQTCCTRAGTVEIQTERDQVRPSPHARPGPFG